MIEARRTQSILLERCTNSRLNIHLGAIRLPVYAMADAVIYSRMVFVISMDWFRGKPSTLPDLNHYSRGWLDENSG